MRWDSRRDLPECAQTVAVDGLFGRAIGVRPWLLKAALVTVGVGALTAGAWMSVPFFPVPMTLQTLAVLLVAGLLGPKLGVASVAGYLALGLSGAPVFASGIGGLAKLFGPTGGYLVAFLPAAFLMGLAGWRSRRIVGGALSALRRLGMLTAGAIVAEVVVFTVGVWWLALYTGSDVSTAVSLGLTPFILGDLLKVSLGIGAVYCGRNLLARWGSLPL